MNNTANIFNPRFYNIDQQCEQLKQHAFSTKPIKNQHKIRADRYTEDQADFFTDASVSPYGGVACIGWLKQGSLAEVKFELAKSKPIAVHYLEAKAMALAILRSNESDFIHIHSDSQAGIEIMKAVLAGSDHHTATSFLGALTVETILRINKNNKVQLSWVKAHEENDWNIICDQLVRYGRNSLKCGASIKEVNHEAQSVIKEMMRVRNLK